MDDEDKLELLYRIETQFTYTGQDRIPVNDIKARFMKDKKKKETSCLPIISNLQSITTPN